MLVDGAGELIVDVMTANRSLASIPSASAILDASNYTFHAISYGKDADGFRNHAHTILSPSSTKTIKVKSYDAVTVSSYHTSSTASALADTYKLLPRYPSPLDRRLELNSTVTTYSSGVPDVGQCLNSVINPSLSAYSHLIGCFPASAPTTYWMVSSVLNTTGSVIFSGTLSSFYNYYSLMDTSGFLTFAPGYAAAQNALWDAADYTKGVVRACKTSFPEKINMGWRLNNGDAGGLLLFGGLYHIGLWYLDLKEMLKQGYYPPYSFNTLNNIRKYKLFAKKTFNKDLLYLNDAGGLSAFKTYFDSASALRTAVTILWDINFV